MKEATLQAALRPHAHPLRGPHGTPQLRAAAAASPPRNDHRLHGANTGSRAWGRVSERPGTDHVGVSRGCSLMVEHQLPKLRARVRFSSPAPCETPRSNTWGFFVVVEPGDLPLPFLVGMLLDRRGLPARAVGPHHRSPELLVHAPTHRPAFLHPVRQRVANRTASATPVPVPPAGAGRGSPAARRGRVVGGGRPARDVRRARSQHPRGSAQPRVRRRGPAQPRLGRAGAPRLPLP